MAGRHEKQRRIRRHAERVVGETKVSLVHDTDQRTRYTLTATSKPISGTSTLETTAKRRVRLQRFHHHPRLASPPDGEIWGTRASTRASSGNSQAPRSRPLRISCPKAAQNPKARPATEP